MPARHPMDHMYTPPQTVIKPRKFYGASTEFPGDDVGLLPALQRSNPKVYRPQSSIHHRAQCAEEKLQLIDRCDRLLAETDQGLAGPFGSSEFEQSARKFWQQDFFRSEEIQDLSEPREQLTGNMSNRSIFHSRVWTSPACRFEYQMEKTCQELRDMSFTNTRTSAQLSAAPNRDNPALECYVENEETLWNPFPTLSIEQQVSRSFIYRPQATEQSHTQRIANHWSLDEVHTDGGEEERADNIRIASQGSLFHPQPFSEEQPCHISSKTSRRQGEAERQKSEKQQSDRGRSQGQRCDSQRSEHGQHDRQQLHQPSQPEQRRNLRQQQSESQRGDMQLSEGQGAHGLQSDRQPETKSSHATSEASVLDNWKRLLLALEEINALMILEEVKTVEHMKEGRRAYHSGGTHDFFTPGRTGRTKQTLRLGPLSEEPRSGKSRSVPAPFQCTVTGPYWEWNSVSLSFSIATWPSLKAYSKLPIE